MDIERVNRYTDSRFHQTVLDQHGGFLLNGKFPCEVEITGPDAAVVRWGTSVPEKPADWLDELLETFRFYAEHICKFYGEDGTLLREFPPQKLFWISIDEIQPSQFYADEDKVRAVRTFVRTPEDIVIPVVREGERFISCDGHTRLYAARQMGFERVLAFETQMDGDYIFAFAREARNRGLYGVEQLELLSHEAYTQRWDRFCDEFFQRGRDD